MQGDNTNNKLQSCMDIPVSTRCPFLPLPWQGQHKNTVSFQVSKLTSSSCLSFHFWKCQTSTKL